MVELGHGSFNTTLVQLKDRNEKGLERPSKMFQYHSGPIKRALSRANNSPRLTRFNTTLVQLKVENVELRAAVLALRFNTTLVQLKEPRR